MSLSRRQFLGTTAAAVVAAGTAARGTVFGANERVGVCVAGCHVRGGNHIRNFSNIPDSEVVALCEVDQNLLEARAKEVEEKWGKRPKTYRDVRDALADPDVHVLSVATPNHWHSLMTAWAIQAGKDVYVEKPISHNVWEGRQVADMAAKSDRIVMHGTQNRTIPNYQWAIRRLHEGIIGEVYMARALCYKPRWSIGTGKPGAAPDFLDWNLWQGPAPERPFMWREEGTGHPDAIVKSDIGGLYVHYNWHWMWDWGNGDIGNQGVHQMDVGVWGMNKGLPVEVYSAGGRYGYKDGGETPNVQTVNFTYADGTLLVFEVRGLATNGEGPSIGNLFYGSEGYFNEAGMTFYDNKGQVIEQYTPPAEEIPLPKDVDIQYPVFINAVKTRDKKSVPCDAEVAHISAAHCHLANIAYRCGRSLAFDPKTERFEDEEANKLLTREYREGFELPKLA